MAVQECFKRKRNSSVPPGNTIQIWNSDNFQTLGRFHESHAVYMFDKVFASFSLLTKKNARQLTRTF